MALRVISIFMAAVFLLALVVQYNDPDPLLWIILYLAPLVLSIFAATGRYYRSSLGVAALYVVLAVIWSPNWRNVGSNAWQPHMAMMDADTERAREVVGLFVASAWMVVLGIAGLRKASSAQSAQ